MAKDTKTEKLVKYGAEVMRETSLAFIEEEGNSVVSPLSIMGAMYLTAACTKVRLTRSLFRFFKC